VEGLNIEELRSIARSVVRNMDNHPPPFDSWFELDVFLKIIARGYRVIPQFEVAGYHIDMVLEGMQGRLAVECDGDVWHGPDRYEYDMARQRMLERCGWIFWRVRGSTFYRNPDVALAGLWETLDRLGIYPTSKEPENHSVSGPVTGHTLVPNTALHNVEIANARSSTRGNVQERAVAEQQQIEKTDTANYDLPVRTLTMTSQGITDISGADAVEQEITAVEGAGVSTFLKPYRNWIPRPLPDPRLASIDDVISGLVEIVEVEGPMLCYRAYRIYARAAGVRKIGRQIRSIFNQATWKALRTGRIEQRNEHGTRDQMNRIVRKAGSPVVVPRTRGGREFHEIPPAEVGEVMVFLRKQKPRLQDAELFQSVLNQYGFERMTSNIQTILQRIKDRYLDRLFDSQDV
jgi:very-short-patch-repair endonuclease